jgi:hypothetical protein
MEYHFLFLSLVFAVPGVLIYLLRKDLRLVMRRLMLCSIPFAFTEFLFYPDYWEPNFLFDLAARIGFGIEDFIFVMGLAAFTGTGYAVVFRKTLRSEKSVSISSVAWRLTVLGLITLVLTVLQAGFSIPMIYGAAITMLAIAFGITRIRRDLVVPLAFGGFISMGFYLTLFWIILLFIPEIFELNWNLDAFSSTCILGVPLEELMYGFAAGSVAVVFYPFVFSCRYVDLKNGNFS